MEKTIKQPQVQIIMPAGARPVRSLSVWTAFSAALLLSGSLLALYAVWGSVVLPVWQAVAMALLGAASCVAGQWLKKKESLAAFLPLLAWPVLLLLTGPAATWAGLLQWLNGIIARWNAANDGGAVLLAAAQLPGAAGAFTLAAALLCGQLAWHMAAQRRISLCAVWCAFWLVVQLLGDTFTPLAGALLICGLLGTALSDRGCGVPVRTITLALVCMAVMAAAGIALPNIRMLTVEEARAAAKQAVHTMRYGQDTLPLGDMAQAGELNTGTEPLMTVASGQEKTLYLRAYVGGVYQDGSWKPLPDSAYGGSNAGMMDWLNARGFDPMTQVAQYYRLTNEESPELNTVQVSNTNASRYFCYLPLSLEDASTNAIRTEQDEMLLSHGLMGARQYTVQERSDYRPAELTVAADWVTNPTNEAQQQYSEAEAAYRSFVYNQYTALDESTNDLMNQLFWQDYENEHDGVYMALSHIRDVLKYQVSYTQTPDPAPDGTDPVRWFLTQSHEGNAVQYAAATVMALRAYGIPARYVEGYYLTASALADNDGTVTLTSQDAHAWAEVYFDGVGWLPVDTMPGCYYDSAALQQMVSQPSAAHRTAAMQQGDRSAQLTNTEGESSRFTNPHIRRTQERYACADAEHRALMIEEKLFQLLHLWGIDAALGWHTEETDALLVEQVPDVKPGEYTTACSLIEKTVYGGEPPEPFEERMMRTLLQKLIRPQNNQSIWHRLKQRYAMTLL